MGTENVLDASLVLWISGSCSTQGALGSWVYFHSMDLCFVLGSSCWSSLCQLQQLPKYWGYFRKAVFDTILASCFTLITKRAKIQHHVKSQFSAWLSVQLSTYGNSCWHLVAMSCPKTIWCLWETAKHELWNIVLQKTSLLSQLTQNPRKSLFLEELPAVKHQWLKMLTPIDSLFCACHYSVTFQSISFCLDLILANSF